MSRVIMAGNAGNGDNREIRVCRKTSQRLNQYAWTENGDALWLPISDLLGCDVSACGELCENKEVEESVDGKDWPPCDDRGTVSRSMEKERPSGLASLRINYSSGSRGPNRTRNAVLEAMEAMLHEVQLHELRVSDLIDAAKVSRPTFYSYFASKLDAVAALYLRTLSELGHATEGLYDRPVEQQPEAAIVQAMNSLATVWSAHRAVLHASMENRHIVPEIQRAGKEIFRTLVGRISRQVDRDRAMGIAPSGTPTAPLVCALIGSTEWILYLAAQRADPALPDERTAASVLSAMWLGALYGAQPTVATAHPEDRHHGTGTPLDQR